MAFFTLKIITYNIHKGFSVGNTRFVLHQIKDALSQVNADVVFLQEIQGAHSEHVVNVENWPTESQFEFLADQLWSHYAYGKNAIYKQGHHGNAILSKYPFIAWENIDVSFQKSASRSVLHGTINIPEHNVNIHIMCIHFGLFKLEREKQLKMLCDRIESHVPHHEPLIIAGDFNDWRGHAEEFLTKELTVKEVFHTLTGKHARTFPSWRPTLAVDRVYYRGLHPEICKRLTKEPWHRLSDHVPLYVEFSL